MILGRRFSEHSFGYHEIRFPILLIDNGDRESMCRQRMIDELNPNFSAQDTSLVIAKTSLKAVENHK